mmetsp:Transcript_44507/g.94715  ORF Transcript_44507/g.94715 Transcript_44507/m.94715 type:complete len:228 (+) Transcript_44507:460-1143(+)
MTNTTSVSSKSSLISSSSSTMSYGTPASARRTLSCPGMRPATGWMPNLTFFPAALRVSTISLRGYCPLATARPYPGTMITLSASMRSLHVSSTLVWVTSPSNFMASPPPDDLVPYPPRMTERMSRFMASHMIFVSAAPLHPIKAPTVVMMGMSSMNPSAHSAHPEYELSTVITTGMSAPPIEAVMCHPSKPLVPNAPPNAARPVPTSGPPMTTAPAPRVAAPSPMLI